MRAADFSRGVFLAQNSLALLRAMASANIYRARIFHRSRNFSEAAILRFFGNPPAAQILWEKCKFFPDAFFLAYRFFIRCTSV